MQDGIPLPSAQSKEMLAYPATPMNLLKPGVAPAHSLAIGSAANRAGLLLLLAPFH
jgi:hypothetical protein